MSSTSEKVDGLSSLPEEVLSRILSLMPTKFAVRTSILSKRWKYLWTSVTKLDFDDTHPVYGLEWFTKFVDQVLTLCETSQLESFRLRFSQIWVRKSSVLKWITEAVRLNPRELDLQVILIELPLSLFTCKTLTTLRLVFGTHDADVWICPSPVNLPNLKTLEISVFSKPSVNAFKLIHGCPVLENLSLQVVWRNDEEEYKFNIPTLKTLKLTGLKCVSVINNVVFNVPNLEYLYLGWILCSLFVIQDLSSLVEARIEFFEVRFDHLPVSVLRAISGAKSLSWSCSNKDVPFNLNLPKFPNLNRLELKGHFDSGPLPIPQFLESANELEYLCIEKPEGACWIEPWSVPSCIMKLRTVKYAKCKGGKYDVRFLKYLLGNAVVLKTLTITCEGLRLDEEMQFCAQLLKFPMSSRYCQIHFDGNYMCTL